MDKLLPCPFCGEVAEMEVNDDRSGCVFVACKTCGISTDTYLPTDKDAAVEAWNTRTESAELQRLRNEHACDSCEYRTGGCE